MIEKTREIQVTNRDKGSVGYLIPDMGNLYRSFESGETKTLTYEELEKLSWVPGGDYILKNCLVVHNQEAVDALLNGVEPEYFYTEADVKRLLTTGSLDEFLDCLDFAPEGILNLIKSMAVDLELNDVSKRQAILEKLNYDVTKAIELKNAMAAEDDKKEEPVSKRRAAVPATEDKPVTTGRRVIKRLE